MQTATTIDLLRHGETTAGPCFLGASDVALTDAGWQKMQRALGNKHYQRIISSPLKRCAEFAQQFADENNIPLSIEDELREIHFGDWELKTTEALWDSQRKLLKAYWDDPLSVTPPNAEPYLAFQARISNAFNKVIKQYKHEDVLLIIHGGVIRQIISSVLSISFKQAQKLHIDYAGITRIESYDDCQTIRSINMTQPCPFE